MNTAKHTPGPWEVVGSRICTVGNDRERVTLAKTEPSGAFTMSTEQTANAHLIAAAPAMYEALRRLHDVLDTRLPSGLAVNQVLPKELFDLFYGPAIEARQALAQAEGK